MNKQVRKRVESIVAWLTLVNAVLALIQQGRHYVALAIKAYQKQTGKSSFGFQPTNVRKLRQ